MAVPRSSTRHLGFTLIELLVVVAIIALLVSILLPSLSKARQQAKAAVCASRLRSFGKASAVYESQFESFAPCDPIDLMPEHPRGYEHGDYRTSRLECDPAHGWLAFYGMDIKPGYPTGDESGWRWWRAWQQYPHGFFGQALWNPEGLWEGFFCPAQNRRNTMSEQLGELHLNDHWPHFTSSSPEEQSVLLKYASGYMVNRTLQSPTTRVHKGLRYPTKPSDAFEAKYGTWCYNI